MTDIMASGIHVAKFWNVLETVVCSGILRQAALPECDTVKNDKHDTQLFSKMRVNFFFFN